MIHEKQIEQLRAALIAATLRAAAAAEGMAESAVEDVLLHGQNFTCADDGAVRHRDGFSARDWLKGMRESRPHWFGQGDSGRTDAGGKDETREPINNPYLKAHWNVTAQGKIEASDPNLGERMRKAAGDLPLGATRPVK